MTTVALPLLRVDISEKVQVLFEEPSVQKALALAKSEQDRRMQQQVTLVEVASPPFKETNRAQKFAEMLQEAGAEDVMIDEVGNVRGKIPGDPNGPNLVVAAHIDTVFPEGTDVKVRQEGNVYYAPGISDDATGLSCLLQIARSVKASGAGLLGNLYLVGTVGEEGNGDLRGCKHLFKGDHGFDGFISIDSADVTRVLRGSTGSRRYRMEFSGPGGHSLRRFGQIASATHALCRAGAKMADIVVPTTPVTTFTVGVVSGGTGVNAIAAHAAMEVDMRSDDTAQLDSLEKTVLRAMQEAVDEENARWGVSGEDAVSVEMIPIGNRPAGQNAEDSPVPHAARAAQQALGIELKRYSCASTDQNIPLSLGLPATTLGGGGSEGKNHSLSEWYDVTDAYLGPQLALLTIFALLGVADVTTPALEKH